MNNMTNFTGSCMYSIISCATTVEYEYCFLQMMCANKRITDGHADNVFLIPPLHTACAIMLILVAMCNVAAIHNYACS